MNRLPGRGGRIRRAGVVSVTVLGALLANGCAHQPAARMPDRADTDSSPRPRATPTRPAPSKHPPAATQPDYEPHVWPAPETDLWAHIRAGFVLEPHADQPAVRRRTQFYATHQRHLQALLKRARPFLYHIVQQIDARHLPAELALVPMIESGYDPSARSYVGASGLWQFMPRTADHMGLARNWWYDARNDVLASTEAALDYLQQLNARYDGDWFLTLAAYNAGPSRVDAAIARSDENNPSYWNLELPNETTEYVPKLLALRRIMRSPARFGVAWPTLDDTPRTRRVALPHQTGIAVAARMLDMPKNDLRRLNPCMRRWASGPDGDYSLLVPADKAAALKKQLAAAAPGDLVARRIHTVRRGEVLSRIAKRNHVSLVALRRANNLRGDRITVGQRLQLPHSGQAGTPRAPAQPTQRYVVQAGDTLWGIAHRYKIDVASLRRANGAATSHLQPGQSLRIPGDATPREPSTRVVARGDSLWSIAHANNIAIADLRRWNRLTRHATLRPGQSLAIDGPAPLPDYYEVEPGDSLWSIADQFRMTIATLRSLNDMSSTTTIQPGQRLRLQSAVAS